MKYTYKFIKDSLPEKKNSRSSIWVRNVIRKISFPVTFLFINTGWSANKVSVLSLAVVFIGSVLLSVNNFFCMLAGILLINFWLVLDCVDGNIARCLKAEKNYKTFMGDFYDAVAGYGPFAFSTIGMGIAAYNTSFLVPEKYRVWLLIIAGFGSMSNIYTRLIHQKYMVCFFAAKKELGQIEDITLKDTEDKKSFAYIRERIDKEIGVSGLFMVWLFVALFTNTFDIMLLFYCAYYVVSFIAVIYLYFRRAAAFETQAQLDFKNQN